MAFNVVLYNNTSSPETVNKSLSSVGTYTGTLKDECSITKPEIMLKISSFPANANYAYIAQFNRYYFIEDSPTFRNGLWIMKLKSDPLMSFKTQLLANSALVSRQQNTFNDYLNDPMVPLDADMTTETHKLSLDLSFTNQHNILIISSEIPDGQS